MNFRVTPRWWHNTFHDGTEHGQTCAYCAHTRTRLGLFVIRNTRVGPVFHTAEPPTTPPPLRRHPEDWTVVTPGSSCLNVPHWHLLPSGHMVSCAPWAPWMGAR